MTRRKSNHGDWFVGTCFVIGMLAVFLFGLRKLLERSY